MVVQIVVAKPRIRIRSSIPIESGYHFFWKTWLFYISHILVDPGWLIYNTGIIIALIRVTEQDTHNQYI